MLRKTVYPVLLLLAMSLSSCYTLYTPDLVQIPMHKAAGEFSIGAQASTSGTNLQASFSPIDHLTIMGNAFSRNFNRELKDSSGTKVVDSYGHKEHAYTFAAGYYNSIYDSDFHYGFYGGFGNGRTEDNIGSKDPFYPRNSSNNRKTFLQGNIGYRHQNIEMALALRYSFVNIYDLNIMDSVRNISENVNYFEPNYTLKVGFRNVKFTTHAGIAAPSKYRLFTSSDLSFSGLVRVGIGIEIQLNRKDD